MNGNDSKLALEPITVLLADDDLFMLDGLRYMIACESDIRVVAYTLSIEMLASLARDYSPDVIVTDYIFGRESCVSFGQAIAECLRLAPKAKILVYSAFVDMLDAAIQAGAHCVVFKGGEPKQLTGAIRKLAMDS